MRAALIATLALTASCASSRPASRIVASQPRTETRAAPRGPAWTLIAPRDLPTPIGDVGALSNQAALVIASGALYRWDHGHATAVCDGFDLPPRAVRADGDRFVVIGGDEDVGVAWWSTDRGEHCERTRLPISGTLGFSLHDGVAIVWNGVRGSVARSRDGGAHWVRSPDLPSVVGAVAGPAARIIAATHVGFGDANGDPNAGEALRFHVLPNDDAVTWDPIQVAPDRRFPIEMGRDPDGAISVVDAVGFARIGADGTVHAGAAFPEYRFRDNWPGTIVPAGPSRFVAVTDRVLSTLDERGVHPFAALPLGGFHALDANAEGAVWLSTGGTLLHGAIGNPHLETVTHGPLLPGTVRSLAVSGPHIVLAGEAHGLTRSDDGGEHWEAVALPEDVRDVQRVAISARGELLVSYATVRGPSEIAASDGATLVRIPLPARTGPSFGLAPFVHVTGERWIVIDRDVLTSDDQGAHWRTHSIGRDAGAVVAVNFRGGSILLLDARTRLWRSDDAGESFVPLPVGDSSDRFRGLGPTLRQLAWDGDRRIAIANGGSNNNTILRSSDGGSTFTPAAPSSAGTLLNDLFYGPAGGPLFAVLNTRSACDREEPVLGVEIGRGAEFVAVREACEHPVAAVYLDEDALYVTSPTGTVHRADLTALARTSLRP